MKFQSVQAFQKHLQEAFPKHLSRVYLVVSAFDSDRKKLIELMGDVFRRMDVSLTFFEVGTSPLDDVFAHLNTKSLFATETAVVFEGIEKLKNKALEQLVHYVTAPSPFSYLILSASSLKPIGELYQQAKKEMIVLDLTDEKPWDREKRIEQWVMAHVHKEGKKIAADVAHVLVQRVGLDMVALGNELEKLICYSASKQSIERQDVLALAAHNLTETSWHLVDRIVWEGHLPQENERNGHEVLGLVSQLRTQLELGLGLAVACAQTGNSQEIAARFSQIRPTRLQKIVPVAMQRGAPFFQRGLTHLFELEVGCKSSGISSSLLFDHFLLKLHALTPS